jgi:hypothetical protein
MPKFEKQIKQMTFVVKVYEYLFEEVKKENPLLIAKAIFRAIKEVYPENAKVQEEDNATDEL